MARPHPLKLSDLRSSEEYPVGNSLPEGRCLIHVKLTDPCMKSIEALINSDKGAFFSLWFEESGGAMLIPTAGGSQRKFHFKSARLQGGEGQSSLECVHQSMEHPRKYNLTCLGPIKHRLTVQATDDIYDRTRDSMIKVEAERKQASAREIKLPAKGRSSKVKSITGIQPPGRKPGRPPGQHMKPLRDFTPKSSAAAKPSPTPKSLTPTGSSRSPRTLRDRIIHLLALKPQRRSDIVSRLKRDTKRSESAMTNLDSILTEVSDIHNGMYSLKASYYSDLQVKFLSLQVDSWHYSESEKQLVRRTVNSLKHSSVPMDSTSESLPTKRPFSNSMPTVNKDSDTPLKKPKFSHPFPSSQSQDHTFTPPTSTHHKPSTSHPPSQKSVHPPTSLYVPTSSVPSSVPLSRPVVSALSQTHSQNLSQTHSQTLSQTHSYTSALSSAFVPATSTFSSTSATMSSNGSVAKLTPAADVSQEVPRVALHPAAANPFSSPQLPGVPGKTQEPKKKKKKEKEKKKKREKETSPKEAVSRGKGGAESTTTESTSTSDASSTSTIPDFFSEFPPISSDKMRAEYKTIFKRDYEEYLKLKATIDALQSELAPLSEQLKTVARNSGETMEIKRKIREKYDQMPQRWFEELHHKLAHIKRMVIDYDSNQTHQ